MQNLIEFPIDVARRTGTRRQLPRAKYGSANIIALKVLIDNVPEIFRGDFVRVDPSLFSYIRECSVLRKVFGLPQIRYVVDDVRVLLAPLEDADAIVVGVEFVTTDKTYFYSLMAPHDRRCIEGAYMVVQLLAVEDTQISL